MIKKIILLGLTAYLLVLSGVLEHQKYTALHPRRSTGREVTFQLKRGPFTAFEFVPTARPPAAVIFFGSGDGGWGPWEDQVAEALKGAGYEVVGIDSAAYAHTDYDLATLQGDFCTMSRQVLAPFGAKKPPLIVGGWSMGAGQAIAVASGPHPPEKVAGLLLASPLSRGRFGLRLADQLNILPTGPGTFAVEDFTHRIDGLKVVQWHAEQDFIDSRAWLKDLTAEHREYDLAHAGHTYGGPSSEFVQRFVASAGWILHSDPQRKMVGP